MLWVIKEPRDRLDERSVYYMYYDINVNVLSMSIDTKVEHRKQRQYMESVSATAHYDEGIITLESILSRETVLPAPSSK